MRLARCNLDCGEGAGATWCCDTPYTWRWDGRFDDRAPTFDLAVEVHRTPIDEVVGWVVGKQVALCVVTGGEPLSQRAAVAQLARQLTRQSVAVEVETNGTVMPGPATQWVRAFNVSPKLANSGVALEKRYKPAVLRVLAATGKARFKFVCADLADLDEVGNLVDGVLGIPGEAVWIMPAGTDPATIADRLRVLAQPAIDRGWNVTTRLHVDVWGDKRGV